MKHINPHQNPFLFSDKEVRTATDEQGEVWFCAKDVCSAIDIQWSGRGNTLRSIPESWVMVSYHETIKGDRDTVFINEAALYKMIFRSSKPQAEEFANWVCSEVLPALRKQGYFGLAKDIDQIKATNAMVSLLRTLSNTHDAFSFQLLSRRLRNLCNAMGEPMPDISLLGQDKDQLKLL
ncbi:MAG: Bro-N domain-containing protein [Nitrincola lacisaponensis]|uniref:BRO-N domain-containing protein n=1 Tax=Nitrincola lacisaponensis TaxID=267850 RepID=UPI00391D72E3